MHDVWLVQRLLSQKEYTVCGVQIPASSVHFRTNTLREVECHDSPHSAIC